MPKLGKIRIMTVLLVTALGISLATAAYAGPFDGITNFFSPKTKATAKKAAESQEANNASTGCLEGMLNAVASGQDKKQGCAAGVQKKFQEQEQKDQREEQALLEKKNAESFGRRIDHVNERIIERQPRIEQINAAKKGDVPARDEDEIVKTMDKKCRNDTTCREAVIEAETETASPGVFKGMWYWMFPGSAPAAKAELKGVARDIAFLEKSLDDIKEGIDRADDDLYTAPTAAKKADVARDKGQLISQFSQATQALKTLKDQKGELDSGYFGYVAIFFAAIGGTAMKKLSDHTVSLSMDGLKGIVGRVRTRTRRKPKAEPERSMY